MEKPFQRGNESAERFKKVATARTTTDRNPAQFIKYVTLFVCFMMLVGFFIKILWL